MDGTYVNRALGPTDRHRRAVSALTAAGRAPRHGRCAAAPPTRWPRALGVAVIWGGLLVALAGGCGGASTPAREPPQRADAAAPEPAIAEGDAPAGDRAPSEQECARLADHFIELTRQARIATGGEPYTDEDADAARAELRGAIAKQCAALPRAVLQCALAATSVDAVAKCQ
jgi:hypothetical protein